jgi:hypothetical protein
MHHLQALAVWPAPNLPGPHLGVGFDVGLGVGLGVGTAVGVAVGQAVGSFTPLEPSTVWVQKPPGHFTHMEEPLED